MKSATLPRPEDKRIVREALPSSNIFTAAVARLYVASPSNNVWKYSGLWGAVAFCKDRNKNNSYFIRVIDMEDGRGVIWEQELYNGFNYVKDCAFFHTFETDDCLAGILFVHQGEADVFFEKVINRDNIKLKDSSRSQKSHDVGRVGYTPGKGFTIDNNDPEILEILRELEKLEDFSAADIDQNQEFIQDFIRQYRSSKKQTAPSSTGRRAPPPPPPPSRRTTNRMPPPPIPPMMNRNNTSSVSPPPPPPPVPNRGIRQTPSIPSFNIPAPPSGGPPPPPPPPPGGMGATPPPPPPNNHAAPSPQSSPIPRAALPAATGGSNDLMAAIRGTGGFGSLKKGGSLRAVPNSNNSKRSISTISSSTTNSKTDMASSLAAVLQQRKTAMQSDDEDDDDDDDWK